MKKDGLMWFLEGVWLLSIYQTIIILILTSLPIINIILATFISGLIFTVVLTTTGACNSGTLFTKENGLVLVCLISSALIGNVVVRMIFSISGYNII